jgi:type IV pilus assembly protein PilM
MPAFLDLLKRIFFWKKGSVLGVDIGSSAIKIVLIEKVEDKIFLRNYAELALGPVGGLAAGQIVTLPPEKIAEELKGLIIEAKISPAQTYIAIPLSASLLSVVELPDVKVGEMQSMVQIEARRYIPVPLNEVSLDWWELPKHAREVKVPDTGVENGNNSEPKEKRKVEVIIAAIHNEVIKRYESIKRGAQISGAQTNYEIEIFSSVRAVVGHDLLPTLVMDIGSGTTNFTLVHEGIVHATHVVSTGGQEITLALARSQGIPFAEAEEIKCRVGMSGDDEGRDVLAVAELLLANITSEATRFIEAYELKNETKLAKIILVGGGARLAGIEKNIAKSFPKVAVERGNPFIKVDSPAFLSKILQEIGPDFATALGVALKGLE